MPTTEELKALSSQKRAQMLDRGDITREQFQAASGGGTAPIYKPTGEQAERQSQEQIERARQQQLLNAGKGKTVLDIAGQTKVRQAGQEQTPENILEAEKAVIKEMPYQREQAYIKQQEIQGVQVQPQIQQPTGEELPTSEKQYYEKQLADAQQREQEALTAAQEVQKGAKKTFAEIKKQQQEQLNKLKTSLGDRFSAVEGVIKKVEQETGGVVDINDNFLSNIQQFSQLGKEPNMQNRVELLAKKNIVQEPSKLDELKQRNQEKFFARAQEAKLALQEIPKQSIQTASEVPTTMGNAVYQSRQDGQMQEKKGTRNAVAPVDISTARLNPFSFSSSSIPNEAYSKEGATSASILSESILNSLPEDVRAQVALSQGSYSQIVAGGINDYYNRINELNKASEDIKSREKMYLDFYAEKDALTREDLELQQKKRERLLKDEEDSLRSNYAESTNTLRERNNALESYTKFQLAWSGVESSSSMGLNIIMTNARKYDEAISKVDVNFNDSIKKLYAARDDSILEYASTVKNLNLQLKSNLFNLSDEFNGQLEAINKQKYLAGNELEEKQASALSNFQKEVQNALGEYRKKEEEKRKEQIAINNKLAEQMTKEFGYLYTVDTDGSIKTVDDPQTGKPMMTLAQKNKIFGVFDVSDIPKSREGFTVWKESAALSLSSQLQQGFITSEEYDNSIDSLDEMEERVEQGFTRIAQEEWARQLDSTKMTTITDATGAIHSFNPITGETRRLTQGEVDDFVQSGSGISPVIGDWTQRISQGYSAGHAGIDIRPISRGVDGDPILSTVSGVVQEVFASDIYIDPKTMSMQEGNKKYGNKMLGNYVKILDDNGNEHIFGHLASKSGLMVGQRVDPGTLIGEMGNTGYSTNTHLHYQIKDKFKNMVDPRIFLSGPQTGGAVSKNIQNLAQSSVSISEIEKIYGKGTARQVLEMRAQPTPLDEIKIRQDVVASVGGEKRLSNEEQAEIRNNIKVALQQGESADQIGDSALGFNIRDQKNIPFARQLRDVIIGIDNPMQPLSSTAKFVNNGDFDKAVTNAERIALNQKARLKSEDYLTDQKLFSQIQEALDILEKKGDKIAGVWNGKKFNVSKKYINDPDAQDFASLLTEMIAIKRNQIAGTAVTEGEERFLSEIIPNIGDPTENLKAKLERAKKEVIRERNTVRQTASLPEIDENSISDINERVKLYQELANQKQQNQISQGFEWSQESPQVTQDQQTPPLMRQQYNQQMQQSSSLFNQNAFSGGVGIGARAQSFEQEGQVFIEDKQGNRYKIPKERLQDALNSGYEQIAM